MTKYGRLQQYLPFTVLKLGDVILPLIQILTVTTVLTVYGIETFPSRLRRNLQWLQVTTVLTVYGIETKAMKYGEEFVYIIVATVLTVYGIETEQLLEIGNHILRVVVATVLTVYGIETQLPLYQDHNSLGCNSTYRLRY